MGSAVTRKGGPVFYPRQVALLGISIVVTAGQAFAAELSVPQQYPTIQSAIDAAPPDATILVSPGTYRENLSISRPVSLRSVGGSADTVIDGGRVAPVIVARGTGPERISVSGFTITNGYHAHFGYAGGIHLESVVAEILDSVVRENVGCVGSGISTLTAAVSIQRNRIAENVQDAACEGTVGGGIFLNRDGLVPSLVANNLVTGHRAGRGAGIAAQGMAQLTIRENLITGNQTSEGGYGGGILIDVASAVISGNVLYGNSADVGGAMALLPADNGNSIVLTGNVMGGNQAALQGSALYLLSVRFQMTRNVIEGHSATALVQCDASPLLTVPANNRLRNGDGPEVSDCVWRSAH